MVESSLYIPGGMRVGGNASVGGSVDIGHNLKVDGWLDAPNIKTPCKGLFASLPDLEKAYPHPHLGWWALIGNSVPADIYVCENGAWKFSGAQGGNVNFEISDQEVASISDAIAHVTNAQEQLADRVAGIEANVAEIPGQLDTLADAHDQINANILAETQARQEAILAEAQARNEAILAEAQALNDAILAEAQARQEADALLRSELSDRPAANGCIEFVSIVDGISILEQSSPHSSTDEDCKVIYVRETGTFALCVETNNGLLSSVLCYGNWVDRASWGASSLTGAQPQRGRLYYCLADRLLYRVDRDGQFVVLDLDYGSEDSEVVVPAPLVSATADYVTIDLLKRLYDGTVDNGYVMQLPQNAPAGNSRHPICTSIIDVDNCQSDVPYRAYDDIRNQVSNVMWLAPGKTALSFACAGLTQIEGALALEDYDTSDVVSMDYAFSGCTSLKSLDLSDWDLSQVTDMSYMFAHCTSLTSIKFGHRCVTRNVINFTSTFEDCPMLEELDLTDWSTLSVTRCTNMFKDTDNLRFLRVASTFFLTREPLPFNLPCLGLNEDGGDNGWLAHIAETAPTIIDGYARIIMLSTTLKEAAWAELPLETLRQKGYAIG